MRRATLCGAARGGLRAVFFVHEEARATRLLHCKDGLHREGWVGQKLTRRPAARPSPPPRQLMAYEPWYGHSIELAAAVRVRGVAGSGSRSYMY